MKIFHSPKLATKFNYDHFTAFLFILPAFLQYLSFVIIPFFYIIFISFFRWDGMSAPLNIGFNNYTELLHDGIFWSSLKVSFMYMAGTTCLVMIMALLFAILLNRSFRGRNFFRVSFYVPTILPYVATGLIWAWLLEYNYGLVNYLLEFFRIPKVGWLTEPSLALISIIIVGVWRNFGYYMVLYLAGLQTIPGQIYEAANIDGASVWQQFKYITLPLLKPISTMILMVCSIRSFQVFAEVFVMTSGGPVRATNVILYYIYEQTFDNFRLGFGSAMTIVIFSLLFVLSMLQWKASKQNPEI
jgi:multiple sugar transport system permease protein